MVLKLHHQHHLGSCYKAASRASPRSVTSKSLAEGTQESELAMKVSSGFIMAQT